MPSHVSFWCVRTACAAAILCLLFPTASLAATLRIAGTGAALGTMRILADTFIESRPDVSIEIPSSLGSGGGIKAVIAGAIDIGLSARPLKDKELEAGATQLPYAETPFVLVMANRHAQRDVTSAQLVQIFSGARTSWPDGTLVRIILRPQDDSDHRILASAFDGMATALEKAHRIKGIPIAIKDQDGMDKAEALPNSLVTASLTSILAESRSLNPIAIDGIAPTLENLANGSYHMSKFLYLVTGPKVSPLALDFIRFIRSPAGAAILRDTGNLVLNGEL